ncbi:MAG: chromosome partitioning protein ParB, partial [Rhizobiaceae bacterium]|nr:chromosome partitioning protein ParB [Rhizobiaceae bacterium]
NIRAQTEPAPETKSVRKDADTLALERGLSDSLGLDVTVQHKGNGGRLTIAYKSLEQLEEICRLLERR